MAKAKTEKVKKLSNKQRTSDAKIKELEGAIKMMQMVFQQVMGGYKQIGNELDTTRHMVTDLQYRFVAITDLLKINVEEINANVDSKKAIDFSAAADAEDEKEGLLPSLFVTDDSVVRITSTTDDFKDAIFRARLKVFEPMLPGLKESWIGKKVGDKVENDINGKKHIIEFLNIKVKPVQPKKEETTTDTATSN